ncbi:hypothetical protein PoB_001774100 [Plakobranchus ocellatus]|uniref:Uncharacterized protein n=1 Tax=Plakobranchus ocellatus TaxID=259542 RepID=A0AAV3YVU1_9GAST|nr:hypothetical protein PoB_001774100 [Plakobranchus ocellatus]
MGRKDEDIYIEADKQTETNRNTDRNTDRDRQKHRQRQTETQTETETEIETDRNTDRDRQKHRQRQTETQTDTDRDRESRIRKERERKTRGGRETAIPQQGDLRLLSPLLGHGASGGARTRDRRIPSDLRAVSLAAVALRPRVFRDCVRAAPLFVYIRGQV